MNEWYSENPSVPTIARKVPARETHERHARVMRSARARAPTPDRRCLLLNLNPTEPWIFLLLTSIRAAIGGGESTVNCIAHCGNSVPACSATMYLAYQSGQFASLSPVRFSCSPCAASARRSAPDTSLTKLNVVAAEPIRPGRGVLISCTS